MMYRHFLSCGNTSMFKHLTKLPTGEPHYFAHLHIRRDQKTASPIYRKTVSRNHYLSFSHLFSPKRPFIYISIHNSQCKCFGPLQSSHLKNRYVALFTHIHTHTHRIYHTEHFPHYLNMHLSCPCTSVVLKP